MSGRRVLTFLLLFCGLSTTPFFSLEQSPDDGLTASSVPQSGVRLGVRSLEEGCSGLDGSDDPGAFFGLDTYVAPSRAAGWNPTLPTTGAILRTRAHPPLCGAEGLTYHANAPPTPSASIS